MKRKSNYIYGLLLILGLIIVSLGCSTQNKNSNLPEPDRTVAKFLDLFIVKDWKGINQIVTKQTKIKYPKEDLLRQAMNQGDQIEIEKVIKIIPVEKKGDIGFGLALINLKIDGKVVKDIISLHLKKEKGSWLIAVDPSDYTLEQNQIRTQLEKRMENKFTEMKKNDPEVKMFWSEYERQVNKF